MTDTISRGSEVRIIATGQTGWVRLDPWDDGRGCRYFVDIDWTDEAEIFSRSEIEVL